jgi:hypothetical protein
MLFLTAAMPFQSITSSEEARIKVASEIMVNLSNENYDGVRADVDIYIGEWKKQKKTSYKIFKKD